MKKSITVVLLSLFLLCSCSSFLDERTIEIVIPTHQWEKESTGGLWYTLRWSFENEIRCLHVNALQRTVKIKIPAGETVCICAYPFDKLNPLGALVSPSSDGGPVYLDANLGYLCGLLLNSDLAAASTLVAESVIEAAKQCSTDFRDIDSAVFLKDVINGKLSESSFEKRLKTPAGPFIVPDGYWIAENKNDPSFYTSFGQTPVLNLPEGTFCWYCENRNLELVISVDSKGQSSSSLRPSGMNQKTCYRAHMEVLYKYEEACSLPGKSRDSV